MGENTSLGEKFGRGKEKKSNTRKNYGSETNSIARKGSRGKFPLAGSRDSVPCGVWGNAPTVFRALNSKRTAHKGAGSEASLPVTSRFLRSAPKLLFRLLMLCRARWARPNGWSFKHSCFFLKAGNFASAEATKGHENRRMSAVALWKPSGRTHVYWLLPGQNQTNQHISVLKRKVLEKGRDSSLPFQIP